MPKFLHAADIHLDSPMRGLPDYPGAPTGRVRCATRRALETMVDLALGEAVDLVLIAGDLYDGDWRDHKTGLFFAAQMTRLREADIKVVVAKGNHDAASLITRNLKLPDNVIELPVDHADTVTLDDLGVAVHGRGFAERHVQENVVSRYPAARPDLYNIGMLHTSAGRAGHDNYAPCSLQDLLPLGYQYWALGHIHRREVLSEDPWVCFPGNLQGRHIRETGPKGCLLVTVEGDVARVEERDLELVRWEVCRVSSADCRDGYELLGRVEAQLCHLLDQCSAEVLAARVVVADDSPAGAQVLAAPQHWASEMRQLATDCGGGRVWLEKVDVDTRSAATSAAGQPPPDGGALGPLEALELTPESLEALRADDALCDLAGKLPPELREGDEGLDLSDDALSRLLPRARALLAAALHRGGETQ